MLPLNSNLNTKKTEYNLLPMVLGITIHIEKLWKGRKPFHNNIITSSFQLFFPEFQKILVRNIWIFQKNTRSSILYHHNNCLSFRISFTSTVFYLREWLWLLQNIISQPLPIYLEHDCLSSPQTFLLFI